MFPGAVFFVQIMFGASGMHKTDVQFQNPNFQVNILNRSEDMDIPNLTF